MKWPKLFRRADEHVGTLDRPNPNMFALMGGSASIFGQAISPRTAMQCTAVAQAVRSISEPMGSLPFHVYERSPDGSKERTKDHPAHRLLHEWANPWTSAGDLRSQLTVDALLHGNGYALVVRDNDGEPAELHRLDPQSISIDLEAEDPVYVQKGKPPHKRYGWEDILHIRAPVTFDGITGESPVTMAKEAIALALAMERHGLGLFSNGARPSGVLEYPGKLSDEAFASLDSSWQGAHASGKSGTVAILEEGIKFNPMTLKSTDAEFLTNRRFAIDEIARAFGVPPHMLFEMGRATWGNSEEMSQAFVTYSLLGWISRWEAAVARALFTEEERQTHFAELLIDNFLRADFTKRSEGYAKQIAARIMSPNEARALEGRAPYPGGDTFENPNTSKGGSVGNDG